MVDFDRRDFLKTTAGTAGATLLAGCTGGGGSDTTKVGMVYATGGLGDGSFNDQAQQGLQQAEEELGITSNTSQPENNSDFAPMQQQFAQDGSYDVVNCIGFAQKDALTANAEEFPDQQWTIVDDVVERDNVASYGFTEETGSYLIGQMAGLLTQQEVSAGAGATKPDETTVGFVGGVESPLIRKFEAGFQAGATSVDGGVDVLSSYVGGFSDPSTAQSQARSMYESGADIVFHAAGASGIGVFRAAQDLGTFALGVDRAQSLTQPDFADVILASMVKRVDTAIFNAIEAVDNGEFPGGEVTRLGLDQNGVEVVYGDELGSEISQDVKDTVSQTREDIIAGDVDVPTEPQ